MRIAMKLRTDEEKQIKLRLADSIRRKADAGAASRCWRSTIPTSGPGEATIPEYPRAEPEASEFSAETNSSSSRICDEGAVSAPVIAGTRSTLQSSSIASTRRRDLQGGAAKIRALLENKKRDENRASSANELLKRCYLDPPDLFK